MYFSPPQAELGVSYKHVFFYYNISSFFVTWDPDPEFGFWERLECSDRSENTRNRKITKFYIEAVLDFFFQVRKHIFFWDRKNIFRFFSDFFSKFGKKSDFSTKIDFFEFSNFLFFQGKNWFLKFRFFFQSQKNIIFFGVGKKLGTASM